MTFSYSQWIIDPSDKAIGFLKSQGVKAVEPGPDFLLYYSENEIQAISKKFLSADIIFYSLHAPFGDNDDLSSLDNIKRTKTVAVFKEFIRRATVAKVKCLIVHPGSSLKNDKEALRLDKLRKSIETLLPIAEENNIKLALENMPPGHVGALSTTIINIVNEFNSPFLGVCFDTGHANIGSENVFSAFEIMHDKIIAFHFHDNDGMRDLHIQPLHGTIDWHSLAKEISKHVFNFPALIEAQPWNNGTPNELLCKMNDIFSCK